MATDALRRDTLSGQLRDALLKDIQDRSLAPGDVLPSEAKLMERYGVGRQVVRESLQSLQATGVVEIVNGKGAVVRPLTSDPLQAFFARSMASEGERDRTVELLEVRRGLEVQSARLAAARATRDEIARIRELAGEMEGQEERDPDRFASLDVQLHLAIAAAAGNQLLLLLVEAIRAPIRSTIEAGLHRQSRAGTTTRIDELHRAIVDAIAAGDADAAEHAMAEHFDVAVFALVADE